MVGGTDEVVNYTSFCPGEDNKSTRLKCRHFAVVSVLYVSVHVNCEILAEALIRDQCPAPGDD